MSELGDLWHDSMGTDIEQQVYQEAQALLQTLWRLNSPGEESQEEPLEEPPEESPEVRL